VLQIDDLVTKTDERDALAARMTSQDPKRRPTAHAVLEEKTGFFSDALKDVPDERETCIVCFREHPSKDGTVCSNAHFICCRYTDTTQGCLGTYVQHELELIMTSAEMLQQHRQRNGKIPCPACKARSLRHPEDESCYLTAQQLALCRAEVYQLYESSKDEAKEQQIWEQHQAEFQRRIQELRQNFQREQREQLAAENERATREFLQRTYPNALQCPRPHCGAGPVLPEGCYNLGTHHGERAGRGFISNACPKCGFFSRERSDWRPWDGRLSST